MRRAFYGVPSKSAPQRKTPCAEPPKSGERRGFPKTHEIFFCQLKRKFVNLSLHLFYEKRLISSLFYYTFLHVGKNGWFCPFSDKKGEKPPKKIACKKFTFSKKWGIMM